MGLRRWGWLGPTGFTLRVHAGGSPKVVHAGVKLSKNYIKNDGKKGLKPAFLAKERSF
jgi:hypothetical protein